MKKSTKAAGIMKLLKQGYTVSQIKDRMAVSESYIHAIKKQMAAGVEAEVEPKVAILSVDNTVYPNLKPGAFVQADTNVDAILNTRATTYGSFENVSQIAQDLKDIFRESNINHNSGLDYDQCEALDMIASKIARILNGDPNHTDSWIDIAGYATLVADRLQGKSR
jgi:hypothetical protein